MVTELPIIKVWGDAYYFDERLKELRAVEDPLVAIRLTNTDSDSVDYLIKNKPKVNWEKVLADYEPYNPHYFAERREGSLVGELIEEERERRNQNQG